jgi:hypothetical protein
MESSNQMVTITKLFGLLTCVLLTLFFPCYLYETNNGIIFDSIVSTIVGTVAISILLK